MDVEEAFQAAMLLHQQGQLPQALAQYEAVLRVEPRHTNALHLSGLVALQCANFHGAVAQIEKAIHEDASNAAFHVNLGIALKGLERHGPAVDSYDRAIALQPDYPAAHHSRGNALMALHRFDEAAISYSHAVALQPNNVLMHFDHAMAWVALKEYAKAVGSFDQVLSLQPQHVEANFQRGLALQGLEQFEAALAAYNQVLVLEPHHALALLNRGNVLGDLQQTEAALASYDQAIAAKPDFASAYYNRGVLLQKLRQFESAIASYDQAIAIEPDYLRYYNRGLTHLACNQLDAAVASWDLALAIQPNAALAHWNKALAFLLGGNFAQGWALYEWRWKREDIQSTPLPQPLWTGAQALQGKTILIHHEQGLGDTLQFCRYVEHVAARGARVILEVPSSLIAVLQGLPGVHQCIAVGTQRPPFDYQCPIVSLPLAFQTTLDTVPQSGAYVRADAACLERWTERVGAKKSKLRVGVVWSGNPHHTNDSNRSIGLSVLMDCFGDNVEVFSLQKELRGADEITLRAYPQVRHFGEALTDFSDTAALCSLMDLVVSVDTSVAHLSAALGKPTWVLLPHHPDWRWLLDRNDSPWYPSVRLYRQNQRSDWSGALQRLQVDLACERASANL